MDATEALSRILSHSCCNPEDLDQYNTWVRENQSRSIHEREFYFGWSIFELELHCTKVEVIARRVKSVNNENGYDYTQYEIRELVWG